MDAVLQFVVPVPKYKNQLASLNVVPKLHWAALSKIKNDYKQTLKSWFIDDASTSHSSMHIEFTLNRHNDRVLDSDNLGYVIKWTIDAIKEVGWLIDDDNITYSVTRSLVNKELKETSLGVRCFSN